MTLVLSALHARGETAATSRDEEPRRETEIEFELAARAVYVRSQGHTSRRDAIAGSTKLRFASAARPIVTALMIEYRLVDDQTDAVLVAGMFTYRTPQWTAAASPFYERTRHGGAGDWDYWLSVRRQIAPRHALGIEIFGALDTGRPKKWTLGYYGTVTETLVVSVAAGSGFDAGPDWAAGASVAWRPRRNRR